MTLQVGALSCYKLQHSSGIAGLIGPFMTFLVWRFCVVAAIPDKGKWNKPCSPFQCWLKMGDDWVGATLWRGRGDAHNFLILFQMFCQGLYE